jgi:nucleoside-diphosphate-sugar epimerase
LSIASTPHDGRPGSPLDIVQRSHAPAIAVVTGASGFVGSWLCRTLAESGIQVRGVARHQAGRFPPGVSFHRADVLDPAALRPALAGADTVVHLAARVHVMRETSTDPLAEFRRANVEGTRILLEEAVRAGVGRFILASTVKAVGEASTTPWTEETPPRPLDPYGVSKLEAEALVRELAERHSLHASVIRLPLVYGPRMKGNMVSLFRLVDLGVPLPFGLVRNRRSLAFVGNVAGAVMAILHSPAARGETFFVSDGHDLSTPELLRAIGLALGRPVRLLPVPPALFRAAGKVGDLIARVRPVPVKSDAMDRLLGSLAVDISKLSRLTGYRPSYSVEQGLRVSADWYRGRM